MNTDRIAVESPEEKEAFDAIPSCACAKDKRIAELEDFVRYCSGFLGCEESRESIALWGITLQAKELMERK